MKISKIIRRDDVTIINKKFGRLLVVKYVFSKNQQRYFECLCDCGKIKALPKGLLKFGSVKSCGCSKAYRDLEEVFQLNSIEAEECLVWTGTKTNEGYGRFQFKRKTYSAHRIHWEMRMGKIPDGMIVCHHCDNRACIKIEHLFLAPPSHNSKDMLRKGRQAKGEKNGSAKLSETDVKAILNSPHEISISTLAKIYSVCHTTIRRILNRETWHHLNEKVYQNDNIKNNCFSETEILSKSPRGENRKINSRLRVKILARDKSICKMCGASPAKDPLVQLHVDHIIPTAKGGKNLIENLQTLCSICNFGKGAEILNGCQVSNVHA